MVGVFFRLFSLLPLWVMYALSGVSWVLLYWVVGYRRKVVRRNLSESFPEKTLREIKRLERKFYRFFTDLIFETLKMATISRRTILRRMQFVNPEDIAPTLEQGRPVSLYLGHLGNWEWISSLPLHLPDGIMAGQVYRRLGNKAVEKVLLHNRERMGALCIEMRDVARRVKDFDIIGYIADQSPRRGSIRHRVPFMNHNTAAFVGAELMTKRQGAEAWYLDVRRVGRGRYEAHFEKLDYAPDAEYGITDAYYRSLERSVLRQPEIYLWTHNKFKHCE